MRTLAQLAKEALEVQVACNLSGVVHGWSRAITELREVLRSEGIEDTAIINTHSINKLWADKCAHLTGMQRGDFDMNAYQEVYDLAIPPTMTEGEFENLKRFSDGSVDQDPNHPMFEGSPS